MIQFLEKHKSVFQIFSFMPLAHLGVMFFAGEFYRRNYPNEAFLQVNQSPGVVLISLVIALVGFFTLAHLVVHAYRNDAFNKALRILWIGNLFLFGVFAIPVYLYRFIINPRDPLIQQMETTIAFKFSCIFFLTSGLILFYQVNVFNPYLLAGAK